MSFSDSIRFLCTAALALALGADAAALEVRAAGLVGTASNGDRLAAGASAGVATAVSPSVLVGARLVGLTLSSSYNPAPPLRLLPEAFLEHELATGTAGRLRFALLTGYDVPVGCDSSGYQTTRSPEDIARMFCSDDGVAVGAALSAEIADGDLRVTAELAARRTVPVDRGSTLLAGSLGLVWGGADAPRPAPSGERARTVLSFGPAAATAWSYRDTGLLGGGVLGVAREWMLGAATTLSLGLDQRVYLLSSRRLSWGFGLDTAVTLALHREVLQLGNQRIAVGASTGLGFWPTCVAGDWCGGAGPVTGVSVRVRRPVGGAVLGAVLGAEVQHGMVNGVDKMVMPELGFELAL